MGMIIGHSRPQAAWTVSGTGAAFLSPVQLGDLPDRVTAIRWLSGTQNVGSVLRLRADWTAPIVPGLLYIANTDLPAGLRVEVAWKRGTDGSAYPYQPPAYNPTQRIVEGPRGERTCLILLEPGAQPVVGCEIRIYNDVAGVPTIPASHVFTIGAAMICAAAVVEVAAGIEIAHDDRTTVSTSTSGSDYAVPGIPYRTLTCHLRANTQDEWFGHYLPTIGKIDRGRRSVYIPRWRNPAGAFDAALAHSYAMIGRASALPAQQHAAGKWFESGQLTIVEQPVPV